MKIPDDFSDASLQGKKWANLERESRENYWNYVLIVEMLPDIGEAAIRNIFERINRNSRKLMPQELRHAKYDGWFVTTVESEAEKKEWKDFGVVTPARMKRMSDAQFISELLAVIILDKIHGFEQEMLDDLYAKFEDLEDQPELIEDDFKQKVEDVKTYLTSMLRAANPGESDKELVDHFKVQTHFYTLWSYIVLNGSALKPALQFASDYKRFMVRVSELQAADAAPLPESANAFDRAANSYAQNSRGASTELPQRRARLNALLLAFHGIEASAGEDK